MTESTGRERPDPAYGQNFNVRGMDLDKVVSSKRTFRALKAKERSFPSVLRQWPASYRFLHQKQALMQK